MRVELPCRLIGPVALLLKVTFCVVLVYGGRACAQASALTAPQTRLVVYAELGMADDEWAALFAALQRDFQNMGGDSRLAANALLIRGDAKARDPRQDGIVVHLEGYCTLLPPPRNEGMVVEGALGWVRRVHGRIEPIIYVDCRLLERMLGRVGMHLGRERRNAVMGEAMARVIMHEWIHVTTQSAMHADHGISQAQFSTEDLLAEDEAYRMTGRDSRGSGQ